MLRWSVWGAVGWSVPLFLAWKVGHVKCIFHLFQPCRISVGPNTIMLEYIWVNSADSVFGLILKNFHLLRAWKVTSFCSHFPIFTSSRLVNNYLTALTSLVNMFMNVQTAKLQKMVILEKCIFHPENTVWGSFCTKFRFWKSFKIDLFFL